MKNSKWTWLVIAAVSGLGFQNCAPQASFQEQALFGSTKLETGRIFSEEELFRVDTGMELEQPLVIGQEEEEELLLDAPAAVYKRRCVFHLEGQKGARWFTERYTGWENGSCDSLLAIVASNNPKAKIRGIETNFVADQVPDDIHKTKCTFSFEGPAGNRWISERYRTADGNCLGAELDIVRLNNPNAKIRQVTANYVYDPIAIPSKNKCSFLLQGAAGKRWISERYIASSLNCDTENATVRRNNPNATIVSVTQNFVHDPY